MTRSNPGTNRSGSELCLVARAFPRPPIDGIDLVLDPGLFYRQSQAIRNQSCEYSKEEFAVKIRLVRREIIH